MFQVKLSVSIKQVYEKTPTILCPRAVGPYNGRCGGSLDNVAAKAKEPGLKWRRRVTRRMYLDRRG
jgi:hypothetical protein